MKKSTESTSIIIGAQSNDHSARLAGVSSKRFFTDALTFARAQLLVTEYYGFDASINFWDVYNIKAEALGQRVVYHPNGIPDVDRSELLIKSPSDLDRIKPPDPYSSGRMPWLLEVNKYYLEMARDGRCMIHLNHIPADTPTEHIHAAVAACHTYGQLPIPENLDDIQLELPKRKSFLEFMQEKGESFDAK